MDDPYVYPGSRVLKNKFGVRDPDRLQRLENDLSFARIAELKHTPIPGQFDYAHLKAIHKHIFQDVYAWAGEPRTIGIVKGQAVLDGRSVAYPHPDAPVENIHNRAAYAFADLKKDHLLKGMEAQRFDARLVYHAAEIWEVHPFREGNTRTTVAFIRQLADEAGHPLAARPFGDPQKTRDAFVLATDRRPEQLAKIITGARELSHLRAVSEYFTEVKHMTGETRSRFIESVMNKAYAKFDRGEPISVPAKSSVSSKSEIFPDLER